MGGNILGLCPLIESQMSSSIESSDSLSLSSVWFLPEKAVCWKLRNVELNVQLLWKSVITGSGTWKPVAVFSPNPF